MEHYEEILSKVSPIFYKIIQHTDIEKTVEFSSNPFSLSNLEPTLLLLFNPYAFFTMSYLKHSIYKELYHYHHIDYSDFANDYYFSIYKGYAEGFDKITSSNKIVFLTKKNKKYLTDEIIDKGLADINRNYLSMFIVNMVINKFSRENIKLACKYRAKDLFIVLVGKNLYETLRQNIK